MGSAIEDVSLDITQYHERTVPERSADRATPHIRFRACIQVVRGQGGRDDRSPKALLPRLNSAIPTPTRDPRPVRAPSRGTPGDPIPDLRASCQAIRTRSFQIATQRFLTNSTLSDFGSAAMAFSASSLSFDFISSLRSASSPPAAVLSEQRYARPVPNCNAEGQPKSVLSRLRNFRCPVAQWLAIELPKIFGDRFGPLRGLVWIGLMRGLANDVADPKCPVTLFATASISASE